MVKVVVNVMPKQELLDPAGKAVQRSLAHSGHEHFTSVRIGKRFELETDRPLTKELFNEVQELAANLLSNAVIEDTVLIEFGEPGEDLDFEDAAADEDAEADEDAAADAAAADEDAEADEDAAADAAAAHSEEVR